jgi:hypothetical protein
MNNGNDQGGGYPETQPLHNKGLDRLLANIVAKETPAEISERLADHRDLGIPTHLDLCEQDHERWDGLS